MTSPFSIESCVENFQEALASQNNGANRIELCAALEEDGLTPDITEIQLCLNHLNIPTKVMIRPRAGDFVYNTAEEKTILETIEQFTHLGVKEIVFGALTTNGYLDIALIQKVSNAAGENKITFHKAIDYCHDPIVAIAQLKAFKNIKYILSSGQKPTAQEGSSTLLNMKEACEGEIELIAAGKITNQNVASLHQILRLSSYHGRKIVGLL